jgi:cytochrome P450
MEAQTFDRFSIASNGLQNQESMMTDTKFAPPWPAAGYIPDHVPAGLVKEFSLFNEPGMSKCPYAALARVKEGPRIFWNPDSLFGGAWNPTKAEDIRFILNSPALFSNRYEAGFSGLLGETWDLVPLELDAPEHGIYRRLLQPLLSPPVVKKLAPQIEARAAELIDRFVADGECEFVEAFGRTFPVSILLQLLGLPIELMDQFNAWEADLLHAQDIPTRIKAAHEINDYLLDLAEERRANPTDDFTSFVVTAKIDGTPLSDDRVIGILYLLFVGGLDTVASSLGFFFRHLAEHPEDQQRLRDHPEQIGHAVEELLRRFSVVTVHRQCQRDIEVGGVAMKAGDWITITTSLASTDADEFSDPMKVDFDRALPRHFGLSFGPHFCMGSHLAKRELVVALQQWLTRVPPFRLKDGEEVIVHGGGVFGVDRMVLTWS